MTAEMDTQPLKVLFLSSDTGGGHRASAEALGAQFQKLFPGSTYDLLDIVKEHGLPPYNGLESWYQHLSSNPKQWSFVYKLSNTPPVHALVKTHLKLTTEQSVRKCIKSHSPDVVISVHPLMNNVPVTSCNKISSETGRHLPIFTVVTDLGSGHSVWFDKGVEKIFIASQQLKMVASRLHVPEEKLIMSGLPIRKDFAVQADMLGERGRVSVQGMMYQLQMREKLKLSMGIGAGRPDVVVKGVHVNDMERVILVMGGGEGVGSLSSIVDDLYVELMREDISWTCTILVVCGRNIKLKVALETRDWDGLLQQHQRGSHDNFKVTGINDVEYASTSLKRTGVSGKVAGIVSQVNPLRMLTRTYHDKIDVSPKLVNVEHDDESDESSFDTDENDVAFGEEKKDERGLSLGGAHASISPTNEEQSKVIVKPLGFVTNMAEYMVAADVLVTKAGPGTIAEAASVGLPVMLTSFLPGQEEGNVDFVIEKQFGEYKSDSDPGAIAKSVSAWLQDPKLMSQMSMHAKEAGSPNAAEDIVRKIGTSVLRWKELHS